MRDTLELTLDWVDRHELLVGAIIIGAWIGIGVWSTLAGFAFMVSACLVSALID
jgi:hypothetical protein